MKARISKAQLEVWKWKEKLSSELKSVPEAEKLKYIRNQARTTLRRIKAQKKKNP